MFGTFSEESLLSYSQLVKEKTKKVKKVAGTEWATNAGVSEEDSSFIDNDESYAKEDYAESYDFTVCVRDNGTVYGTRGKCRLGKETSEDQAALLRASNKKRSRGTLGGSLKKRVARDQVAGHLANALKDSDKELKAARKALEKAATNLEQNKGQEEARAKYKAAQAKANQTRTQYERVRSALNRRVSQLQQEQQAQNQGPRKKATKDLPDWVVQGKQLG